MLQGCFGMKNVYIFQIVSQVGSLVGTENAERETDQRPDMYGIVGAAEMMTDIVHLGMTVVAAGYTVIGTGGHDLVEFDLAVLAAFLGVSRLQESPAAAAAVIVRFVRRHFNNVLLADHRFDDKPEIIGNRVAITFTDDLAGILDGEGDAEFLIPVGIDLQASFPDPFGIVLIDGSNFKVVLDVELFQSGPD
jgi:hypothetical protein